MQVYKSCRVFSVALYLVTCSGLFTSIQALADDSVQITTLQNRVNALEQELIMLKTLLKQNATYEKSDTRIEREVTLSAQDKLTLKVGKASLELSKNGRVTLNGAVFDIKTTQDTEIRGSKIQNN